jgi:hypothetical protein
MQERKHRSDPMKRSKFSVYFLGVKLGSQRRDETTTGSDEMKLLSSVKGCTTCAGRTARVWNTHIFYNKRILQKTTVVQPIKKFKFL